MANSETVFSVLKKYSPLYGRELPEDIQMLYVDLLADMPDDVFKNVSVQVLRDFVPTAAHPIPLVPDFLRAAGLDEESQAVNAISIIRKTAERLGQYPSVDFGGPINSVIKRYGGWQEIVFWGEDKWQFHERNFILALKSAIRFGSKESYCPGLYEETESGAWPKWEVYKISSLTGEILSEPNNQKYFENVKRIRLGLPAIKEKIQIESKTGLQRLEVSKGNI
jgi:hypothetical protein